MHRTAAVLLLSTSLLTGTEVLPAQSSSPDPPMEWRRWAVAAAGALAAGVPSILGEPVAGGGACGQKICTAALAGVMAGWIGYHIGSARDQAVREGWRAATTLHHRAERVPVPRIGARRLATEEEGRLWVLGDRGLARIADDLEVLSPPSLLRRIRAAVTVSGGSTIVATGEDGAWMVAAAGVTEDAAGLEAPPVLELATFDGGLLAATPSSVAAVSAHQDGDAVRFETGASATLGGPFAAMRRCRLTGAVWILEGTLLTARDPWTLRTLGSLQLPGRGRMLALEGGLAALGIGGDLHLVDVSVPEAPRLLGSPEAADVESLRDVAAYGSRLYVAAGGEGLLVLDVSEPGAPAVVGWLRDLGSVDQVAVASAGLFVLDRRTGHLRRVLVEGGPVAVAATPGSGERRLATPVGRR